MEDHTTNHALTEVALALAMAFFSIMILAMVSMSIPRGAKASAAQSQAQAMAELPDDKVKMQQNDASAKPDNSQLSAESSNSSQQFVFYFNQQFFNQKLQTIDLTGLKQGEVVLALPANLTVAEALKVKGRINRSDLVITQYNEQWQQRLEALSNE